MASNEPRRSRLVSALIILFVALGVTALITLFFGGIAGEEIKPDTFARRKFTYWEIPLFHVQVVPIKRRISKHPFVAWLQTNGYVKSAQDAGWDLVGFQRTGTVVMEGDSRILCAYLDSKTGDDRYFWQVWSQDHPKLAALLWPQVSNLAQRGLYIGIPDLMEIAAGADSLAEFRKPLIDRVVAEYTAYAERRATAEDHESAAQALTAALELDPDNKRLLEARAAAYDELAETEKAASDRKKAESLD